MPLSLWSSNSLLSIASRDSVLSIGSVNSLGSIGSVASAGSAASWMSAGSLCSAFSAGSLAATFAAGARGRLAGCPAQVDWRLAAAVIGGTAVAASLIRVAMAGGENGLGCCCARKIPASD